MGDLNEATRQANAHSESAVQPGGYYVGSNISQVTYRPAGQLPLTFACDLAALMAFPSTDHAETLRSHAFRNRTPEAYNAGIACSSVHSVHFFIFSRGSFVS